MMKKKIPMDLVSGFIGIFFICVVIVDLYFVVIQDDFFDKNIDEEARFIFGNIAQVCDHLVFCDDLFLLLCFSLFFAFCDDFRSFYFTRDPAEPA